MDTTTHMTGEPVEAATNVVGALADAGVDIAFTVPGESFLAVLNALYDEPRIRTVATRHESGASFMADAYTKLTQTPAICMATRAVGAANLSIGIHNAQQDSVPMIAILGQVSNGARHRESFQETDLDQFLRPFTKWAFEPTAPSELGALTHRAVRTAISGRPGPVAISLREDVIREPVRRESYSTIHRPEPEASSDEIAVVEALLRDAHRPLLLVGGEIMTTAATPAAVHLAESASAGVVTLWRRPDAFPNDHPHYLGHAGLGAAPIVREAMTGSDLWIVVGGRLDENTLDGYTLPTAETSVVHVGVDADGLDPRGEGFGVVSTSAAFLRLLAEPFSTDPLEPASAGERRAWITDTHETWQAQTTPEGRAVSPGYADQFEIARTMREHLPPDTIVVTDAGNFSAWSARFLRWNAPFTFVGPGSGAMGYAIPGAVGAQLARPDRPVLAVAGDGGFLMTAMDLQTAAREQLPIVVVVFNNGQYGTIRMHQERKYPGRPIATTLGEVDFVALARGLGCGAELVLEAEEFSAALDRAFTSDAPYVLEVRTDPEQISISSIVELD